jgi:hypothetical protein
LTDQYTRLLFNIINRKHYDDSIFFKNDKRLTAVVRNNKRLS